MDLNVLYKNVIFVSIYLCRFKKQRIKIKKTSDSKVGHSSITSRDSTVPYGTLMYQLSEPYSKWESNQTGSLVRYCTVSLESCYTIFY